MGKFLNTVVAFYHCEDGFIGSLIGGVLGLVGAKNKQKHADAQREYQYSTMRRSAERAGFNPLTAMQNGGAAAFMPSTQAAPLASFAMIGDAIQGAAEAATKDDAQKESKAELERDLIKVQIEQAKAGVNAPVLETQKVFKTSGSTQRVGNVRTATASGAIAESPPVYDTVGQERTRGFSTPWGNVETSPTASDAEYFEQRYGDIAQEIGGVTTLAADLYHTGKQRYDEFQGKRAERNEENASEAQTGLEALIAERNKATEAAREKQLAEMGYYDTVGPRLPKIQALNNAIAKR